MKMGFALNLDNGPVQKAISFRHRLADEGNINTLWTGEEDFRF
jgi:hypothetical protein